MSCLIHYETTLPALNSHGKQLFGYARIESNKAPSFFENGFITLVDIHNQTHYLEVEKQLYADIVDRFNKLSITLNETPYIWVEVDYNHKVINWLLFKSPLKLQLIVPVYQACYDFGALYTLFNLVESIQMIPLRNFMREILANQCLMTSFVSLPASKRHHHSFPGGLLTHSIECALLTQQAVKSLTVISNNEAEVAMVAALLHDIGKIKTIGVKKHTSLGRLIDHEQFTLLLLSEAIHKMSAYWQQGAEALQYLLIWKESLGVCRFVSGNAIKMADRLSTSASLNHMAFDNKPSYFHFSAINIGPNTHYLNRLN